ncbi:RNA 2',3'-cyclic phosphodiesterase [Rhizorhapis sp. SPR117]|uniref:RNA 2',3'-cyclic phosphodiesterase n=1 Tax=Rhizorhapis sp. SPR117 TaxID=2912611 RepID=UPI001EFFABC9|nr:RNA 2',3'-cyclic phosphodiesterase [Rhizorhapis sp. SPR117]
MHRLFIAIQPPAAIRTNLLSTMGGIEGARWQTDAQLHLTLRFIGEVNRHQAQDIAAALGGISASPFTISLSSVGAFDRRGRVEALWVGVTPHDELKALHNKVDRACTSVGVPPDKRAYLPHITLARLNRSSGPVDNFLALHAGLSSTEFTVDQFGLFESELGRQGAVYHLVERYRLV